MLRSRSCERGMLLKQKLMVLALTVVAVVALLPATPANAVECPIYTNSSTSSTHTHRGNAYTQIHKVQYQPCTISIAYVFGRWTFGGSAVTNQQHEAAQIYVYWMNLYEDGNYTGTHCDPTPGGPDGAGCGRWVNVVTPNPGPNDPPQFVITDKRNCDLSNDGFGSTYYYRIKFKVKWTTGAISADFTDESGHWDSGDGCLGQ